MNRIILGLLIISFVIIGTKCGKPPPNDYGGTIVSIKFGTDWDLTHDTLLNKGTSFGYGITKVYYEIKFEDRSLKGGVVKKKWQLPFESVCFIPKDSKRICGEFHYFDLRIMDSGTYQVKVFYWEAGEFKEYPYAESVNTQFTIE
uniref:Uncharacterized protein n=1 Tax=candidate division WOR-3 bacterium TaxID=2052148 RepID=A0A7V3VUE9_UNCW3